VDGNLDNSRRYGKERKNLRELKRRKNPIGKRRKVGKQYGGSSTD
jgi:hypothetical protein